MRYLTNSPHIACLKHIQGVKNRKFYTFSTHFYLFDYIEMI